MSHLAAPILQAPSSVNSVVVIAYLQSIEYELDSYGNPVPIDHQRVRAVIESGFCQTLNELATVLRIPGYEVVAFDMEQDLDDDAPL